MASEQSYDSPPLCANGCGFFGRQETQNLCSKCYRELGRAAVEKQTPAPSPNLGVENSPAVAASSAQRGSEVEEGTSSDARPKDRCPCCNKRVGLLKGFRCRCGNVCCSEHRHPEEHRCTFDFKAAGRDLLAKANPIVRADKLDRI